MFGMYQARGQHYPCLNTWPKRECHQDVSHAVLTTASHTSKCNHSYQEPARCTGAISSNAPSTAWNTPERFGNANDSVAAFTAVLTAAEAMVDCCGGDGGERAKKWNWMRSFDTSLSKTQHKREMASSSPSKDHMVALAGLLQASTADASASKQTGASGKTGKQKKKPKTKKQRKKEKQQAKRDQRRHTKFQHLHVSLSLSLSPSRFQAEMTVGLKSPLVLLLSHLKTLQLRHQPFQTCFVRYSCNLRTTATAHTASLLCMPTHHRHPAMLALEHPQCYRQPSQQAKPAGIGRSCLIAWD